MMFNIKIKTIQTALNFVGVKLTKNGCIQLLALAKEAQKLIDIIKKGD